MLVILSSLAVLATGPATTGKPVKAAAPAVPAASVRKRVDGCAAPEPGRRMGHQFMLPKCVQPRPAPKAG